MKKKSDNLSFKYTRKFSLGVLLLTSLGFSFNATALNANTDTTSVTSIQLQAKKIIKGVVKSNDGVVLPGATIHIKGEANGTITNEDGKFELSVPNNCTLIFKYIGFDEYDAVVTPDVNELNIC